MSRSARNKGIFSTLLLCILLLLLGLTLGRAQSVLLHPVADTTLIAVAPNNNLGGKNYVNAGTTQNFTKNRGLFLFDPAAAIPSGSIVTSVSVTFEVVGQPVDGYSPSQFGLHRMLAPWGEGVQNPASNPGIGLPAAAGEATWNDRFALQSAPWSSPGGAPGQDYVASASSEAFIYDVGNSPYGFASTPGLVADVQGWLDQPLGNFGWMLIGQSEAVDFTARRFASREDAGRAPILEIQYTAVPEPGSLVLLVAGGFAAILFRRIRKEQGVFHESAVRSADNPVRSRLVSLPGGQDCPRSGYAAALPQESTRCIRCPGVSRLGIRTRGGQARRRRIARSRCAAAVPS